MGRWPGEFYELSSTLSLNHMQKLQDLINEKIQEETGEAETAEMETAEAETEVEMDVADADLEAENENPEHDGMLAI